MSDDLTQAQIEWAQRYSGYERLARSPEALLDVIHAGRDSFRRDGSVPDWCGVDFLRGWAFYIVREHRHAGGWSVPGSEFDAVLAAVARHPAARPDEVPPLASQEAPSGVSLPTVFSNEARMHGNREFLEAKRARLWEPHVAPVNHLVERIAQETGLDVPYVDPDSGGIAARVLFVLQAPARAAAHGSGMLSADNDDGTAERVWWGYASAGMPRTMGVHWNAVPWYVGTREKLGPISPEQVTQGRRWLRELLALTPNVRVLVTFGRDAEASALGVSDLLDRRGIAHLHSIHPSPRNYNSRRERTKREVSEAFEGALRIARGVS